MLPRLRARLTYANVTSTLALVIAVGGGAAYAAGTVFSTDIVDNEVYSSDVRNDGLSGGGLVAGDLRAGSVGTSEVLNDTASGGGLTGADIRAGALNGADVADEGLTGDDIADQSGVDSCISSVRRGSLCVRAENFERVWNEALQHCANLGLRMPSLGEALQLAKTHDIPDVGESEKFWTEESQELTFFEGWVQVAYVVDDAGNVDYRNKATSSGAQPGRAETVCVMTPTN